MRRAIVTPDKHFPFEDKKAIKVVCKAIELVKPDIYIDLGDTGEWESVSHWQWKKKKKPRMLFVLKSVDTNTIGSERCSRLVKLISTMGIILQELVTLVIISFVSVVMLCMVTIMIFSKALLRTLMGSSQRGQ